MALVLSADCIDGSPERGYKAELIAAAKILASCTGLLHAGPLCEFMLRTSKCDQDRFSWKGRAVIDQVTMLKHTNFIVLVDRPVLEPGQKKTQVVLGVNV